MSFSLDFFTHNLWVLPSLPFALETEAFNLLKSLPCHRSFLEITHLKFIHLFISFKSPSKSFIVTPKISQGTPLGWTFPTSLPLLGHNTNPLLPLSGAHRINISKGRFLSGGKAISHIYDWVDKSNLADGSSGKCLEQGLASSCIYAKLMHPTTPYAERVIKLLMLSIQLR